MVWLEASLEFLSGELGDLYSIMASELWVEQEVDLVCVLFIFALVLHDLVEVAVLLLATHFSDFIPKCVHLALHLVLRSTALRLSFGSSLLLTRSLSLSGSFLFLLFLR